MGKNLKGKELGEGLRQRKDGRYEGRAVINGIKINIIKPSLKECVAAFDEAKKKAKENVDLRNKNITLKEWFDEWFDKYKAPHIKSTSIFPMKSKFNNTFGARIGDKKVIDIRNVDIQMVINELMEAGRASSSIRDALGRVRDCMESAKNNKIISVNPCFDITVPCENKKIMRRFLTIEEQNIFLSYVSKNNNWYKEMFYIMFLTGMRVGEVGGLKWDDVDFENKCINIQRSLSCSYNKGVKTLILTSPKTYNSYRKIPFIGEAEEMFISQKDKQSKMKAELGTRWRETENLQNLVFTTSMGSPVTRYVAEKQINKIVDAINIEERFNASKENREPKIFERVYPHAIRHTFCSRCFEKDMNPKAVQQLMGHKNYSTTIDIYTHITESAIDSEAKKFGFASEVNS